MLNVEVSCFLLTVWLLKKSYQKAVCRLCTLWPSIPDAKYQLPNYACTEHKTFEIVFRFKSDTVSLPTNFYFIFIAPFLSFFCRAFVLRLVFGRGLIIERLDMEGSARSRVRIFF